VTAGPPTARFASVILDVDSTLCGIEGIDWLASRRGGRVADESRSLTERAMDGEITLDAVYGARLALIRPTLQEIVALSEAYRAAVDPDAPSVIERLRSRGVHLFLVSGGLRRAIEPLALDLGFMRDDVFAVELRWDASGAYVGFDRESPLTSQEGKLEIVRRIALDRPALAVGDGATDAAMRPGVEAFAAFTGFVTREHVLKQADYVLPSFKHLQELVG
jgi:phosphoserine phosphatase